MAHLVAEVVERGVGGVFDVGEAVPGGVGFDVAAAEGEQGTDYVALNGQNAVKSRETGAP